MNRFGIRVLFTFAALVLAGVLITGCRPGRRHDTIAPKPGVKSKSAKTPKTVSRDEITGIRNVDFKNHTYLVEGQSYPFRNGQWSETGEFDARADLKQVLYGNLMDNGREQAVVVLFGNWGGGNMSNGSIHVYDFHGGQAWEVSVFPGDSASLTGNLLYVDSPEWAADDPFCCPTLTRTDVFRWNGLTFVQEQSMTEPAAQAGK